MPESFPIVLSDLTEQLRRIRPRIDAAIANVLDHGQFIMGPEVLLLEEQLGAYCGVRHVVTCANGTDAIQMILMAKGIGPGDAVICPAFTFTATPEAIAMTGATPAFCDVLEDTYNIDAESIPRAAQAARANGLTPRAVIAVDLFGQPADYGAVADAAAAEGLWILADAAQSFGAKWNGIGIGKHGFATATSFFPAKPLGCFGDGGAVLTDNDELAEAVRSIRVHGQGHDKYDNVRIGMNSRLDTIQAAVLLTKLEILAEEIVAREKVAARYGKLLNATELSLPKITANARSAWAQYTVRVPSQPRDELRGFLGKRGVSTAVYYPKALSQQQAYAAFPVAADGIPVSERLTAQVLSLPIHPYLRTTDQDRVVETLQKGLLEARADTPVAH